MSDSSLLPLDPDVAALLCTTDFDAPPVGAKERVRRALVFAGVVSPRLLGGTDRAPHSTAPGRFPTSHARSWQTVVDTVCTWRTWGRGKAAIACFAAMATAAAGTLLAWRVSWESSPEARAVTQEDVLRSMPRGTAERAIPELLEPFATPSAPSTPSPRSVTAGVKKSGATDSLGDEQRLLAKARAALGRGELDAATQELERHARLFANGSLAEEREALRIVTLARQGNLAAARERAARFRRIYPRSIQLITVEGAIAERR